MIDGYSMASIVIRLIGLPIWLAVVYWQVLEIRKGGDGKFVKWTLLSVSAIALSACTLSLVTNLYRQNDGNLFENVRHITMIGNATFFTVMGTAVFLMYYRDRHNRH